MPTGFNNTTERFWSLIEPTKKCWRWHGKINHGYGVFSVRGKWVYVHRLALGLPKRKRTSELEVDHICRNKSCVNPLHLRLVTHRINSTENSMSVSAINRAKTSCRHGHPFDVANTYHYKKKRRCRKCSNVASKRYYEKTNRRKAQKRDVRPN